jgi:hypothetical protein
MTFLRGKQRPVQAAFPARGLLTRGVNLAENPAALALANLVEIEPVGRRKLPGSPPGFLAFDAYCRIVRELAPPLEVHLHGAADPLLHPRLFDMVAYAVARGLDVSVTTRLAALAPSRAEACVESGLRRLRVLSAGTPTPLAARNLTRLEEAKHKLKSVLPEIEVVRDVAPAGTPSMRYAFSGVPVIDAPAAVAK